MSRDLVGKVLFITGASSGIGAEVAVEAARRGMDVVLMARRRERLEAVAERVRRLNRREYLSVGDVSDEAAVRDAIRDAAAHFGRLDAVLANAGYGFNTPVLDVDLAEHRAIFETNYFGTVHTLVHGAAALRGTPDGLRHLLVTTSSASEIAPPLFGPYAATKAAQDSLCQALRAELADEGFAVTSIHPIGTRTEFFDQAADRSGGRTLNTPDSMMQSTEHVARRIVDALERPKPEVWPSRPARFALAAATAFPRLTALGLRRFHRRQTGGGGQ